VASGPSASVLQSLANALKIEIGDLIGGVELPPNGGAPLDLPREVPAIRRAMLWAVLYLQRGPRP
jgi:hypothetical protein